jgi:hypothetical protein
MILEETVQRYHDLFEVEQLSMELENNGVLQMGDTSQVAPPTA